ncbi:MAG: argininosuccinate lyase [Johnsonella sp.]|nr:argininosuccinate lyase [Johnsonella sp.]
MKLWSAGYSKQSDSRMDAFNSSISVDSRMFREDIEGSIAHVRMLGRQRIIDREEALLIESHLRKIREEIEEGALAIDRGAEDIHMFIEEELTKRCKSAGKRLHTARSRNDQVALDLRLYVSKECKEIQEAILLLIRILSDKAAEHLSSIMPGYTHLQRAQPVSFAHHLMAYVQMLLRDLQRLEDASLRTLSLPLGSGALAGTTYPIDREFVREELGFLSICANSLDAVSDRDFAIETVSALSILMMHLSRFCEEIILWNSMEFGFVRLDDAFTTGSSIMPQKKNPDVCELVRGKSARVFADLQSLLVMMKGLPLAYNKDMQEDKEAVFDAIDTVKLSLEIFTPMIESMEPDVERMREAAGKGFINATDCADYLSKKGMPFRDAYSVVGELVESCKKQGLILEELSLEEYKKISSLFDEDIYEAISIDHCMRRRKGKGAPAPERVSEEIAAVRAFLEKERSRQN